VATPQPSIHATKSPLHSFFFQAEDGIRDFHVTGVQTCALPISYSQVKLIETLRGVKPDDYLGTDYLAPYIRSEVQRIDPERFTRSEERRVGKEWGSRWWPQQE